MCKFTMFAIVALVFVVINQICAETRQAETDVYDFYGRPLVSHSYNIGDVLGVSCVSKLVPNETYLDKLISINFLKDGELYHKSGDLGSGKIEDYPVKGIQDISGRGWSYFSQNVAINEHSGGATNQTRGSYTCQN
ncbi:unnamed protein product [Oppiella nova]|uniref:Uncharacterized protein n=1 Tax=Oppiella nova TaxID=334625 RepID=A0A7R9LMA0_9ACAR|nr:unnamed protein product [Oppiella nova]CAG2165050.1 unnamed protein product [Oppiella nova]